MCIIVLECSSFPLPKSKDTTEFINKRLLTLMSLQSDMDSTIKKSDDLMPEIKVEPNIICKENSYFILPTIKQEQELLMPYELGTESHTKLSEDECEPLPDISGSMSQMLYRCFQCSYYSTLPSLLKDHLRKQHLIMKIDSPSEPSGYKSNNFYSLEGGVLEKSTSHCHQNISDEIRNESKNTPTEESQQLPPYSPFSSKKRKQPSCMSSEVTRHVHETPKLDNFNEYVDVTPENCHQQKRVKETISQADQMKLDMIDGLLQVNPNKCPNCEYAHTCKTLVRRHVLSKHTDVRPHPCPHCDYKALLKATLQQHLRIMHSNERPYICQFCEYTTSNPPNLKLHISVKHSGAMPFKCHLCNYGTISEKTLDFHIKGKHTKKLVQCNMCEFGCSQMAYLKVHVISKHCNKKPYKCEQCDFTSAYAGGLKSHTQSIHSDIRPHKCPYCDHASKLRGNLAVHIQNKHSL